jgi:hypothetical protein
MPREYPDVAPPSLLDAGPTIHVQVRHTHAHRHRHHFEPETHDEKPHHELHIGGRKGVPQHETYESDKVHIRKRPFG